MDYNNNRKRVRTGLPPGRPGPDSGILNERILVLVFESLKWDLHTLTAIAAVNRKLEAVATRLLWRELCLYRAPRMLAALTGGSSSSAASAGRIDGGWKALAKLMLFCCGYRSSSSGHVARESRFSKTSGRSFLAKKCRGDLLYVSDPCEHPSSAAAAAGGGEGEREEDLGVYRGVFRGFMRSKTRAFLIKRGVVLEEKVRCPYCGARVWNMTTARLVPKSAARRLGCRDGGLEYFVCVNGHLHGICWLIPLSSSDEDRVEEGESGDGGDDELDDGGRVENGSTSSTGEDVTVK